MARLSILCYPDPRLSTVAQAVKVVDDRVRRIVNDMFETMYAAPGIGLAATQVNVHEQIIVIDVSENGNQPLVLINPVVIDQSHNEIVAGNEGCLSVPAAYESVPRFARIKIQALDHEGKPFQMEAEGLLSVCIQHEIDHLRGKVFVDYLSPLKRNRIKAKLLKRARDAL
jgi:peptide deformylase